MNENPLGLIDQLSQWFGGAATALMVGVLGRLMFHSQEASSKRRRFFGPELIWEIPTSIALAIIGDGLANFLGLNPTVTVSFIGLVSYLGPRWIESALTPILLRFFGHSKDRNDEK